MLLLYKSHQSVYYVSRVLAVATTECRDCLAQAQCTPCVGQGCERWGVGEIEHLHVASRVTKFAWA
jgi:hypothetical protein